MINLKKYLKQTENYVYTNFDGEIKINLDTYKIGDNLLVNYEENSIWVDSLISSIYFSDGNEFEIILDYPVLLKYYHILIKKEFIKITFNKDSEIIEVPTLREDIKQIVSYIERLLGGRERFKDINHLFLKLYSMYNNEISNMDLIHLEVLISQVLRDKTNPVLPARIGLDPEHPVLLNIKKNVFNSGLLTGLAFENVNAAINTGLINKTELQPSILEKLLTGTLIEKKERED